MTRSEKCLADAVKAGRISAAAARRAQGRVEELLAKGFSEAEAMARAANWIKAAAEEKQRRRQAQSHPKGTQWGVAALFARDIWNRAGYSNIEARALAIEGIAHAELRHLLDAFRGKVLGFKQDLPGLRQLVRALYGETTDARASQFAEAWSKTTDKLVLRFNAAGGSLPRKEDWRLPQHWDRQAVKRAGEGEFTRFMQDALDAGELRINDFDTGEAVAPERAAQIIADAWRSISTNGVADLVPGQPGGVALATSRSGPRAFQWATAEAYLKFQERFGGGDAALFDALTDHIRSISRDIAMLEILGPNPHHQARVLIDVARQDGAGDTAVRMLRHMWNQVNGAIDAPVNVLAADVMRGTRAWLTSAQLGSAMLSSVTDFGTLRQAAAWNGLESTAIMRRYLALLNPINPEDRLRAVQLGFIAEGWTRVAIAASRHQTDVIGRDLPGRIADGVLRASGMSAHTQAAKWAFKMEFSAALAADAGKTLDQLPPEMQRNFARYGLTAADWDVIRKLGIEDFDGMRFISPERLASGDAVKDPATLTARQAAASRYLEMVNTESGYAIIEPGAVERAILLGGSQPGTLGGEFRRSASQYKSFSVAMMARHAMRGLDAAQGGDRGRYIVGLAVSLTLLGAFAIQLKEVANGRDPRDMDDWKFWGAAFAQGGGSGILGDFLYAGVSRAERGFYMTVVGGPTGGLVDDLVRLTGGNIQGLAEEKDTHFGRELARFVQRNTPGTSLWYSRLAVDRLMWERLQELLDPHAAHRWRRLERDAMRERNQEFWWRPGDTAPERFFRQPAIIPADR
jgi:hypothetical protein